MTWSRLMLAVAALALSGCGTWSGNRAPFGKAVSEMHSSQAVSSPVLTVPTEPPATDGRKVSQALEAYRGEGKQDTGGISPADSGIGR